MRALTLAFLVGLPLASSALAAPLAPTPALTHPSVELVPGGCGWGWHRRYWKDRWGNLRRGPCSKNWWW
jgi:hypothetical protein